MSFDPYLDKILSNIKVEPEEDEQDENLNLSFSPSPPPNAFTSSFYAPPPQNEFSLSSLDTQWNGESSFPIKDEPKDKSNSPEKTQIETNQMNYLFGRAEDVKEKLTRENENLAHFTATMDQRFSIPIPADTTVSPLTLSAHNATYQFQASSKNVNSVTRYSNPHANLPFDPQQVARLIGADIQELKNYMNINSNIPAHTIIDRNHASRENHRKQIVPTHTQTQTTDNTAHFHFTLSEKDLLNLTQEKKELLRQFKKAFNVEESNKPSDMRERLEFREADRNYYRIHERSRDRERNRQSTSKIKNEINESKIFEISCKRYIQILR